MHPLFWLVLTVAALAGASWATTSVALAWTAAAVLFHVLLVLRSERLSAQWEVGGLRDWWQTSTRAKRAWGAFVCLTVVLLPVATWLQWFNDRDGPKWQPPRREALLVTSGELQRSGTRYYLERSPAPDLELRCADTDGRRKNLHASNGCLPKNVKSHLGRQVTVRHTEPRGTVPPRASFYEMTSGSDVLVAYEQTVRTVDRITEQRASRGAMIPAGLTMIIVPMIVGFLPQRFARKPKGFLE